MALPVAHFSFASGLSGKRDSLSLVFLGLLSFLPDFDLFFVWFLGQPMDVYHRTWSHSLLFALVGAILWRFIRPPRFREISAVLVFAVVVSHSFLDFGCTQDAADHGVMFFWPFSDLRIGWPILVPLYLQFADSPFTWSGALRFTFLEVFLAVPLWALGFFIRRGAAFGRSFAASEDTD